MRFVVIWSYWLHVLFVDRWRLLQVYGFVSFRLGFIGLWICSSGTAGLVWWIGWFGCLCCRGVGLVVLVLDVRLFCLLSCWCVWLRVFRWLG